MIRALYTGTTGMRVQQHKMDYIGNNIANVSTIGYKRSTPNFKETLYDIMENRPAEAGAAPLVGNGVRVASVRTYFTQGSLTQTNNSLDMALEGPGFFAIDIGEDQATYIRSGNFKLSRLDNGDARLDNWEGYPVLNEYGQPFYFEAQTQEDDILVNQDGTVYSRDQYGAYTYEGRLGIYNFQDPDTLQRVRGSYFIATEDSGPPLQAVGTRVLQRWLEQSNVDMSQEMTDLIMAQRVYQLNSRVVQAADEMEKQANSLRG